MELLPSEKGQDWLFRALAELIARQGPDPFLSWNLVEPTERYFPDRWNADADSVSRLASRLLAHIELGQLEPTTDLFYEPDETPNLGPSAGPHSSRHEGTAAWFAGIDGKTCRFGMNLRELDQPDSIVGVMSHEVAHAYRHFHDLMDTDRDMEELLTDVTTVYLGLGILTVNGAYRFRMSGSFDGLRASTSYSHSSKGYLSLQAMSFLLAVQTIARGARGEVDRIASLLETNQSACFRAACDRLDQRDVVEMLGLPDPESWPERRMPITPVLEPQANAERTADGDAGPWRFNEGCPVFRVRSSRGGYLSTLGMILGMVAGVLAVRLRLPFYLVPIVSLLGGVIGYSVGRRQMTYCCSDPSCEERMGDEDTVCPGCGGTIMGVIGHANDRLKALEALEIDETKDQYWAEGRD